MEQISADEIRSLLQTTSTEKNMELDTLLDEIEPIVELDRTTDDNLFQAQLGNQNIIRFGLKGIARIQSHAYAESVIITAIGTPGYISMGHGERSALLLPAKGLLDWAVGTDPQSRIINQGHSWKMEQIIQDGTGEVPGELLRPLNKTQLYFGKGLLNFAIKFILYHELAHLKFQHSGSTIEIENEADRFAAEWMSEATIDSSDNTGVERLVTLFGISAVLLWVTVPDILGEIKSTTHPKGYDRLYHVLDNVIASDNEQEYGMVWDFVARMLYVHMWNAGYIFDKDYGEHVKGDSKVEVNYLIDLISKWDRNR
ncbi:MAG: hypothetical protein JKY95_03360 [Planctomycetaceae bacterium]|nr:hypothetical protein [Planctomycetaceae bacterium]